jgi:carbonic anhydrase
MFFQSLIASAALVALAAACPQHDNGDISKLRRRADPPAGGNKTADWAYEASYNWGKLDPAYQLCQTGTQQSPIALSLSNGLALNHVPTFNYNGSIAGVWANWGYGPAFTVAHPEGSDWTTHPSFTFDNMTAYLKGWHIHAPADHSVGGDRSKAELHLVHVNDKGKESAVLAIRLDPGNFNSTFFEQLPPLIGFDNTTAAVETQIDFTSTVQYFSEFWTYRGSLTSPPCTEGIRWFVARTILFTGVEQMQAILGASTYSARAEQEVWQHRINE